MSGVSSILPRVAASTPPLPIRPGAGNALAGLLDRIVGERGCLFTFHRAARTAEWADLPDRGFYLDLAFLDRLLGHLRRTGWSIVTMDEVVRRAAEPCGRRRGDGRRRRYANFSVDDCYRDTWDLVVPLFRRHGVPVTLFVTTGIPDRGCTLWNVGLEAVIRRSAQVRYGSATIETATPDEKRAAFAMLQQAWGQGDPKRAYLLFCAENGVDPRRLHDEHAIEWDMLAALRDDPCVELGGHTVSHPRVSTLPRAEALAELAGCRARLRGQLGVEARHFAFPYGRAGDARPRDFALARQAGFASAATTRKGLVRRGADPWSLPRNTLNGDHRSLLLAEAHLAGLTGAAARLLGRT